MIPSGCTFSKTLSVSALSAFLRIKCVGRLKGNLECANQKRQAGSKGMGLLLMHFPLKIPLPTLCRTGLGWKRLSARNSRKKGIHLGWVGLLQGSGHLKVQGWNIAGTLDANPHRNAEATARPQSAQSLRAQLHCFTSQGQACPQGGGSSLQHLLTVTRRMGSSELQLSTLSTRVFRGKKYHDAAFQYG